MTFKKLIGKIHLWLGLASGLVVFIIGITGCLYVFIDEIKPIVYKDRLEVAVPDHSRGLSILALKDKAQNALGKNFPLQSVEIPNQEGSTISFRTRKFNEQAFLYSDYIEYYYRVYVNPYTHEVVKVENTKWEFFNLVVYVHISLLLGHTLGGQIIAWSVVIFVITLITGLVLWWPKNKKAAKKRFWFRWKETTKWKKKNFDLHNILGFYMMMIGLVIALTGLVWAFEGFDKSVQWLANGGKTYEKPQPVFSDTTLYSNGASLDSLLKIVQYNHPNAKSYFLSFPKSSKSTVNIFIDYDNSFQAASVKYDQFTGKQLEANTFDRKNNGEKLRALNFDIHTGAILGLPGKIIAFFASLIAASLPVTGFLIWWGRTKKNRANQRSI